MLFRIKETKSQVNLPGEERHANVKDAFWGNPAKLNGRTVLLVDDVITTGATMENCTKALLASGAKKVYCISIARVIVDHHK
jgi:competence protein ComFC